MAQLVDLINDSGRHVCGSCRRRYLAPEYARLCVRSHEPADSSVPITFATVYVKGRLEHVYAATPVRQPLEVRPCLSH